MSYMFTIVWRDVNNLFIFQTFLLVSSSVADPWHFLYGSGSSDPYLWLMDPDADPGGSKTYGSGTLVHLCHSSKIKSHKEVTKQYKSRFFYYFFCLMMEGSETRSVLVTNGSGCGSGRPNYILIRIRNTDFKTLSYIRRIANVIFYGYSTSQKDTN
jgi:hypothetical protein